MSLRILTPLAVALFLGLPSVARAQSTVTATPAQGPPGTHVTLTGTGWNPYYFPAPIQFWEEANGIVMYEADVGSVTSSDPGCAPTSDPDTGVTCNFSVQVTVPSNAPAGVTGTLVDGAFPISELFLVAPDDDDCCTAAAFNVTTPTPTPTPTPPPSKPPPIKPSPKQPCPAVFFLGARGSGEKLTSQYAGMGQAVFTMYRTMKTTLTKRHLSVESKYDNYPADSVAGDLVPSPSELLLLGAPSGATLFAPIWVTQNLDKFLASIEAGINDAMSLAERTVRSCPNSKLVLAGYSQGAMAMHQAEAELASSGQKSVLGHIAGTLLLADGDRVKKSDAQIFGTAQSKKHVPIGQGVRPSLHLVNQDVWHPKTTAEICNAGDLVCDFTFDPRRWMKGVSIHTSYTKPSNVTYLLRAANWLAAKIK